MVGVKRSGRQNNIDKPYWETIKAVDLVRRLVNKIKEKIPRFIDLGNLTKKYERGNIMDFILEQKEII